jgi:hypothetical protein
MAELFWPADIVPSSVEWRIIDSTAVFNSALSGVTRTVSRPGTRLACTMNFSALSGQDRGRVQSVLANLRGRSNRIWLYDSSYTQRGAFPVTELVENNTFAASTGWTAGSYHSLVLQDRVMRVARSVTGTSAPALYETTGSTSTTYAAYASRAFLREGRGTFTSTGARISTTAGGSYAGTDTTGYGLKTTQSSSGTNTSLFFTLQDSQTSGTVAGDYFDVLYTSLSRCAVVDNGLNALTYSDQIDNAAWIKTKTTCAGANINAFTAPDGTLTGDRLVETSDAGNEYHYITGYLTKPASVQWWCIYGAFRAGDGGTSRPQVTLKMGDVSHYFSCNFNLSAGTMGTPFNFGSASSAKAYMQDLGNGWYYCAIVGILPAAVTGINNQYFVTDSSGSTLYTGNGAGNIGAWRLGAAASQYPVRLTQTTTAATTGTSQTGITLNLKALPVSTNSLLLPGDWVECSGQLNMVTAPLNSDAAGLGFLQLQRPFTTAPADNAPVIINRPIGRFLLAEEEVSWSSRPGVLSDFSISFVEDIA